MENAVQALKIAGAVLLFILALSLSISSLTQANSAVSAITNMYDNEAQYDYVRPSNQLTRVVGVDAIVPTMYQAYEENIIIYFKNSDNTPLPIYYKTDANGIVETDDSGQQITVDYVDLSKESFSDMDSAKQHLSMILAGKNKWKKQAQNETEPTKTTMENMLDEKKYGNQFMSTEYQNGFYEFLSNHTFVESLGEYYEGNDGNSQNNSTTATKIKKRVITYTLNN